MLSPEQIELLIERSLRGEASFDELVSAALFAPGPIPELWRDWPVEAREAWDDAEWLYTSRLRRMREGADGMIRTREFVRPTLSQAWAVVEASMAHPHEGSRLTWLDISLRLAEAAGLGPIVSVTATQYQIGQRLGFRFSGRAGEVARELVRAPCESCGLVYAAWEIEGRRGPCCQK
jgi:hypothetical protein